MEKRIQRNKAITELQSRGFSCDIPPRRLGDRFSFRVADVPGERRREVQEVVLQLCPSATVEEEPLLVRPGLRGGRR